MADVVETNVRIPEFTWRALEDFKRELGCSRDEAVRTLLGAHLAAQEACEPVDRLTHIATVLRHPLPSLDPTASLPGRPLRLRIPPQWRDRAHRVSLRLPGQSERRGHRDYQPRPLTDALVTAVARKRPEFADEVLDGVRPLIRHRAAAGLWGLVMAATTTRAEDDVYDTDRQVRRQPYPDRTAADRRQQLVAEALREEVAWHSRWRYEVAAHLAGRLLRGPEARANEQMLYDQTRVWELHRFDLELTVDRDYELLDGLTGGPHSNLEGRGGTAVWRAERLVSVQDFEEWIMGKVDRYPRVVASPGWHLDRPSSWTAVVGPAAETWLSDDHVLSFTAQERSIAWPLRPAVGTGRLEPVPGMEAVIRAARALSPGRRSVFAESMLVRLDMWSGDGGGAGVEDEAQHEMMRELLGAVRVPPHLAREFGFITLEEERQLRAEAWDATIASMNAIIDSLLPDDEDRTRLRDAIPSTRAFKAYARRKGTVFVPVRAWWIWPVRSVADEVERGSPPAALEWLAARVRDACARTLERSMELAWHAAFEGARPPESPCDIDR